MDPYDYGSLYQTLCRTEKKWGDRTAYGVPPMPRRPYHPAGVEYTWSETLEQVERLKLIYFQAGYGQGHRVAILFHQRPEFVFHYYALNALGCSVVPLNPEYRSDEIAYVIGHSEVCLIVAIEARLEDVQTALGAADGSLPIVSFEHFPIDLPRPLLSAKVGVPDGSTEAALLYTSGTTGRPKGCILTNEYFHTFGSWYVSRGGLLTMREGEERMYNPLPLHHANCLAISLPGMLLIGGALFFPDRFHSSTWWHDLVACRISAVHYQGVIPNMLLQLPYCAEERGHKVRFGFGSGVDPTQHALFEKRFGIPLVEFWAMSETGRFFTDNFEPRRLETRSIGRHSPGLEARIVDGNNKDSAAGAAGELVIRHSAEAPRKGFFLGYLKDEAATEDAWRDGWFHTGDFAFFDESGMLYFVDRRKNIIRRSGENIAAAEIDACLLAHPKVKQVAALAVPDELREEEVMVCVVTKSPEGGSPDLAKELFEWCSERLAYFKVPAWVLFVDDLPVTTSQRVHKIQILPPGVDPRLTPGIIDLREAKKAPGKTAAV